MPSLAGIKIEALPAITAVAGLRNGHALDGEAEALQITLQPEADRAFVVGDRFDVDQAAGEMDWIEAH